jgi:hypothetical protein
VARCAAPAARGLAQALVESRNRTLAWLGAFGQTRRGWTVPRQYDCNPPLWTLGHVAWHAEWWCLRGVRHLEQGGIRLPVASEPSCLMVLTNGSIPSASVRTSAGKSRCPMYRASSSTRPKYWMDCCAASRCWPTTTTLRCTRSAALYHEDVRGDHRSIVAIIGRSAGRAGVRGLAASVSHNDALHFPGGNFTQGWSDADGFAWPDELPPQKVYVPAFEMDAALVSNAQYLEFVEDGGYEHPAYWSAAGRQWLMMQERSAPRYWSRHAVTRSWVVSRFGAERTSTLMSRCGT